MSAPLSASKVRPGIASRILAAAIMAPIVVLLAPIFALGALVAYIVVGGVRVPRPRFEARELSDEQAERLRAALDHPDTLIH